MEDISKPPLGQTLGNRTIVTRRTYTLEFKLGVLEWMNTHKSSIRAAARRFDVHRRMIQRWSEGEAELNEAVMTSGAQRRKIRSGRPPLSDELEDKLIQWFDSQKDFGVLVSDRDLQRQALAIANDINLENFKASSMWVKAWKRRHGVSSNHGNNERDVTIPTKTSNPQTSRLCGDALLTHTNPRDTIHLIFEEGETNIATPTNDLVYLDYDTPEHNYCKLNHNYFTSSSMIEEEGSEMVHELLKGWDDMKHYEIVILDGEDEKVVLGHEEVVGEEGEEDGVRVVVDMPSNRRKSIGKGKRKSPPTSKPTTCCVDGVLNVGKRLSQPVFTIGPELVFLGQ